MEPSEVFTTLDNLVKEHGYYNPQPIGQYARELNSALEELYMNSDSGSICGAMQCKIDKDKISSLVEVLRSDSRVEKYAKEYDQLWSAIDEEANEICQRVFRIYRLSEEEWDVEIAQNLIGKIENILNKDMPKASEEMENLITSNRPSFASCHVEEKDDSLLQLLYYAYADHNLITDLPITERNRKEVTGLKDKATQLYNEACKYVVDNNERLIEEDVRFNQGQPRGLFFRDGAKSLTRNLKNYVATLPLQSTNSTEKRL